MEKILLTEREKSLFNSLKESVDHTLKYLWLYFLIGVFAGLYFFGGNLLK